MSAFSGAVKWAGEHPVALGVGVFAVGAVVLLIMSRGGGGGGDNGMASFYAAQAASAASGNALASTQAQVAGATAIAKISADRDTHIADTAAAYNAQANTVQAQTDVRLAQINAGVLNEAERTRQQAQKQQFWLGVGQQQLQGQSAPYLISAIQQGNQSALAALLGQIQGGTTYNAAH